VSVLPRVVTRNWRLKLASFGLALFLWAVVTVQPRNRQTLTSVPVEVVVRDEGWTLAEPPSPATVDVRLGGSARELLQFPRAQTGSVRVVIDRVTSQDTVIRLRNDWVELDGAGLVVENVLPATVRLRFEQTRTTALPLSVRTQNEFPGELALAQPLGLTPPVVRVRGAARMVEDLDSIPLAPLDLATIDESGIYRVAVDTSGLGGLIVEPTMASIAVRLERAVERVVGNVPVVAETPEGSPIRIVVTPATIPVTLRGALTPVNQADVSQLAAIIAAADLSGLSPGEERTVQLRLRGVPPLVRAFSPVDTARAFALDASAPLPDTGVVLPDTSGARSDTTRTPRGTPREAARPRVPGRDRR
jgi:YbbR domain-containing protein